MAYYRASPSKLNTWLDCRRKFRLQYIDRVKAFDTWAHFSYGNSVHAALSAWWDLPREQRTPQAGISLVTTKWIEGGYENAEQSASWRAQAGELVEAYLATIDPDAEPVNREANYSLLTSNLNLSGRLDRLDRRDGELVVVDYKTGKAVPTEDEARSSQALALYAAAAAYRHKEPCVQVELHHIPSNTVATWRHTTQSLDRHLDRMDAIGVEAAQAHADAQAVPDSIDDIFPATTGPLCAYCPYLEQCPEGSAVTSKKLPWEGLAIAAGD